MGAHEFVLNMLHKAEPRNYSEMSGAGKAAYLACQNIMDVSNAALVRELNQPRPNTEKMIEAIDTVDRFTNPRSFAYEIYLGAKAAHRDGIEDSFTNKKV